MPAGVQGLGVESVDVLQRVYRKDHLLLVQMHGKRHLDENARDACIGVQARDEVHELLLGGIGGELVVMRGYAAQLAVAQLGAHVGGGTLVVADEHDRQAAGNAARCELGHLGGGALAHLDGQFPTINNRRQ